MAFLLLRFRVEIQHYSKNLDALIAILKENEITIGVETQGSRWQDWFYDIDELTISPKPPSSKMKTDFKFLIRSSET